MPEKSPILNLKVHINYPTNMPTDLYSKFGADSSSSKNASLKGDG